MPKALACHWVVASPVQGWPHTAVSTKVNASTVQRRLEMASNMDSELLLKFIGYFPRLPFGIVA